MVPAIADESIPPKPLRLWPGVAAAALIVLGRFVVPIFVPEAIFYGMIGAPIVGLAIAVWWAFFSRAQKYERWGAVILMVVALVATLRSGILHKSIATGMMGMMFALQAIPILGVAFVIWAVASRRLADGPRRVSMVATILLACGGWALLRTDGITGEGVSQWAWRWSKSPEERLLAQAGNAPAAVAPVPAAVETPKEPLPDPAGGKPAALPPAPAAAEKMETAIWPGFRGPERDGIVRGVRIETNWSASPPAELWRRPIGPGWSSFAVHGDLLYTQEQRGDDEIVACYKLSTGEPVWTHRDTVRFWESNAGAGPRATPTLSNGRVYTFGATGILNALNEGDGAVVWSRNAASDTKTKVPMWGFSGSPLVVDDIVIVAAAGKLAAYDLATGAPRWSGPDAGVGYSSPHRLTLDGVAQILLLNGDGAVSVAPADGKLLWKHAWPGDGIVQPALTADGDILIGSGSGMGSGAGIGVRRIALAHEPGGWTAEAGWTSAGLKPYYNDIVVHAGHAYGFDGRILSCIDLKDGKRKWKGGRYGYGQLVLLPEQNLLLVLSEEGELGLVAAAPDKFTELARVPAIEGKTWNHPVVAGNVLLVRNDQEMAAFRLPVASR